MILISLKVLSRICLTAQMDLSLFSSNQEQVIHVLVEVKAHATSKTIQELFLFVVNQFFVLVYC